MEIRRNIERRNEMQDAYLDLENKVDRSLEYKVGSLVLVYYDTEGCYKGPWRIKEKLGPNVYRLDDGKLVNIRRLKLYYQGPNRVLDTSGDLRVGGEGDQEDLTTLFEEIKNDLKKFTES